MSWNSCSVKLIIVGDFGERSSELDFAVSYWQPLSWLQVLTLTNPCILLTTTAMTICSDLDKCMHFTDKRCHDYNFWTWIIHVFYHQPLSLVQILGLTDLHLLMTSVVMVTTSSDLDLTMYHIDNCCHDYRIWPWFVHVSYGQLLRRLQVRLTHACYWQLLWRLQLLLSWLQVLTLTYTHVSYWQLLSWLQVLILTFPCILLTTVAMTTSSDLDTPDIDEISRCPNESSRCPRHGSRANLLV